MSTFYMVEMRYPEDMPRDDFNDFYFKHISMLLTIPGFLSAQRYETGFDARSPFLAAYRLTGPEVMSSEAYTSQAGRTSVDPTFRARITNWDRNLVTGPIDDLNVPDSGWLVVIDRLSADAPPLPEGYTALEVVGLDETIAERGVRKGESGEPDVPAAQEGWTVRAFRPVHAPRYPK